MEKKMMIRYRWLVAGVFFGIVASTAMGVQVGDPAPAIEALDQDGKMWDLSGQLGEKPLVVYFYPAAMTGGCTKQACAYRDHQEGEAAAFRVVGISGDAVQNLKWFQESENLNFTLLSDPEGAIAKAFGVPVKQAEKVITRTVNGEDVQLTRYATPERWTFIINSEGRIVYREAKVKPLEDLTAVLEFIKTGN